MRTARQRRASGVRAAACYSDVLNVEVVPRLPPHGPANATPLRRRHRCSLQLSARPVIAPGALERPRRAVQWAWSILAETASFRAAASTAIHSKLKLRRRQLVFRSRTQTGTLLQSALSPAWRGRSLLVIGCRREVSKKTTQDNSTTPSGPVQDPVGQLLHTSRYRLFWSLPSRCKTAASAASAPWRRARAASV